MTATGGAPHSDGTHGNRAPGSTRPTWPAIPLAADALRDSAIRAAGGLLALTHN